MNKHQLCVAIQAIMGDKELSDGVVIDNIHDLVTRERDQPENIVRSRLYVVLDEVDMMADVRSTDIKGIYTNEDEACAHVERIDKTSPSNAIERHLPYWEEHELS